LVPVNEDIFPDPLAARPMEVFELVQLYIVPATLPEKFMAVLEFWWHNTWFATGSTAGTGFTVIVKNELVPVHVTPALVYAGVTVMVAVTGTLERLVAVNDAISPDPAAARPMEALELAQL
jgi:hypothetical protein